MPQNLWAELTCMAASQASRGCTRSCRLLYLTPGTRFFPPLQQRSASSASRLGCSGLIPLPGQLRKCKLYYCQAALEAEPALKCAS